MAWATPITHSVGDILTASDWNITSNDLSFLAGTTGVTVATSQTTASTSYANLATVGPAVTLTTGANAIVIVTGQMSNSTTGISFMGYAISGATTLAAADATAFTFASQVATDLGQQSCVSFQTGLTAGSNTFTAKYRVNVGTGTFSNRQLAVIPLP